MYQFSDRERKALDAMLYKRRKGLKPRPCETPDEREAKMKEWFAQTDKSSGRGE